MIVYLSIGGSGSTETLEQAALRAIEAECPLVSAAIVEDARFGDVDATTMSMLVEELDFLLRAQIAVVSRHVGRDLETSVSVVRGDARDVIERLPASSYLIGGPIVPGTADISELINDLSQLTGRPVELLI